MLRHVDAALLGASHSSPLARSLPRPLAELAFFGLKQARACLFAAVIFLSVFIVPRGGLWHIPRY
ncbi:MAG TPA: DUF817 domain-containing protein, partial [Methylibium sp.]